MHHFTMQGSRAKGNARGKKAVPGTPNGNSAHGTPQQTPKSVTQRPAQPPAGRPARTGTPSKRTLDASEDAEQQNQSPSAPAGRLISHTYHIIMTEFILLSLCIWACAGTLAAWAVHLHDAVICLRHGMSSKCAFATQCLCGNGKLDAQA